MGFGDLKSASGLKVLNDFLSDRSYIEGWVKHWKGKKINEEMDEEEVGNEGCSVTAILALHYNQFAWGQSAVKIRSESIFVFLVYKENIEGSSRQLYSIYLLTWVAVC